MTEELRNAPRRDAPSGERLKRYDLGGRGCDVGMEFDETGEYVRHEDAMQIIREQQAVLAGLVAAWAHVPNIHAESQGADNARAVLAKWRIE